MLRVEMRGREEEMMMMMMMKKRDPEVSWPELSVLVKLLLARHMVPDGMKIDFSI
jgi:hypothetical protein